MTDLEKTGQRRTILISISILMVSIHTIYFYHQTHADVETKKTIQQIIRFILTVGLLVMVYRKKNWARIVAIVLFAVGCLSAIIGLIGIAAPVINKSPLIVMAFIYGLSIYHFGLSKSFMAFFKS